MSAWKTVHQSFVINVLGEDGFARDLITCHYNYVKAEEILSGFVKAMPPITRTP